MKTLPKTLKSLDDAILSDKSRDDAQLRRDINKAVMLKYGALSPQASYLLKLYSK